MQHLKVSCSKLNIPKVCVVCEENLQWNEVVFLYKKSGDYNKAAKVIMDHPEDCFEDITFKEIIVEVTQPDIFYDAVKFYIEYNPKEIKNIMNVLTPKIDPAKVVTRIKKLDHLPLIRDYLIAVQEKNIALVNEALNSLYIEEENYEALRNSIDKYNNFDGPALSLKLKKHDLIEFKKIAAYLFEKNKRYSEAIDICKEHKLYKQAMEIAAESGSSEIATSLLEFFIVEVKSPTCFSACLYTCYDLVKPDEVLFMAWRYNFIDYIIPYLAQVLLEYTDKIDKLVEEKESFGTFAPPQAPPINEFNYM